MFARKEIRWKSAITSSSCAREIPRVRSWPKRFSTGRDDPTFLAYSAGSHPSGWSVPRLCGKSSWRTCPWKIFAARIGMNSQNLARRKWILCSPCATTPPVKSAPLWPGQPMTAHWGVADPAAVAGFARANRTRFPRGFHDSRPQNFALSLSCLFPHSASWQSRRKLTA